MMVGPERDELARLEVIRSWLQSQNGESPTSGLDFVRLLRGWYLTLEALSTATEPEMIRGRADIQAIIDEIESQVRIQHIWCDGCREYNPECAECVGQLAELRAVSVEFAQRKVE